MKQFRAFVSILVQGWLYIVQLYFYIVLDTSQYAFAALLIVRNLATIIQWVSVLYLDTIYYTRYYTLWRYLLSLTFTRVVHGENQRIIIEP